MRVFPTCAATALLLSSACSSEPSQGRLECPEIPSTSGLIIGHKAPNVSNTFEFLGIKYGQAPVGDLRFVPPKRYIAPEGTVYEALDWNADCPFNVRPITKFPNFTGNGLRIYNEFTGELGNQQSEDCLALNIWTKSPGNDRLPKKPVLLFIHGGRYYIPGPHSPFYYGQYLADREDVVVVTINYRLNVFGFSGAPGIQQNSGLLDQRSAIEWVRDNIAGFGGDPKRITVFGQSAGAASADGYAVAYKDDPIVAGLISMSGSVFSFRPNSLEYSESIFYNMSSILGCGNATADPKTVVACVRSKETKEILLASAKISGPPSKTLPLLPFHPTTDNITVWEDYAPLFKSGQFAKVPYLAGTNDYEAGTYRINAFNANVTLAPEKWQLFTQRAFTCPAKYSTELRAQHGVPTWRYRNMGDWDNLRLFNASGDYPNSGAYHGSDIGLVFNTAEDITGQADSPAEKESAHYIMAAFAAFARDPKNGLRDFGWPVAKAKAPSLLRLGYQNQGGPNFVNPETYDDICPSVEQNDPTPADGAF